MTHSADEETKAGRGGIRADPGCKPRSFCHQSLTSEQLCHTTVGLSVYSMPLAPPSLSLVTEQIKCTHLSAWCLGSWAILEDVACFSEECSWALDLAKKEAAVPETLFRTWFSMAVARREGKESSCVECLEERSPIALQIADHSKHRSKAQTQHKTKKCKPKQPWPLKLATVF